MRLLTALAIAHMALAMPAFAQIFTPQQLQELERTRPPFPEERYLFERDRRLLPRQRIEEGDRHRYRLGPSTLYPQPADRH